MPDARHSFSITPHDVDDLDKPVAKILVTGAGNIKLALQRDEDVDAIKTCEATRTSELMDNEIELTTLYSVTGSPTLIINGEKYLGSRTSEDIKTALCCAFNDAPSECDEVLSSTTQAASGSC